MKRTITHIAVALCVACMVACNDRVRVVHGDVTGKQHIAAHDETYFDPVLKIFRTRHVNEQFYFRIADSGWLQVDAHTYNAVNVGENVQLRSQW